VLKQILFQVHWFFGVTAGLVLAVMGITGALYSYEEEILEALNLDALFVQPGEHQLPLAEFVRRVGEQTQGLITNLRIDVNERKAAQVWLKPESGAKHAAVRNFDPYTGALKPDTVGSDFFKFVLDVHRFLAAGEYGKQVTAACALVLVFFCLSGLYLRWPRQPLNWRAWLIVDWMKTGRSFNWSLHSVLGTWCLVVYLSQAVTGLNFSYAWFNEGLTRLIGDPPGVADQRPKSSPTAAASVSEKRKINPLSTKVNYVAIGNTINAVAGPELRAYNLRLPTTPGAPAFVFFLLNDSPHPRALNQITLDPQTGEALAVSRYAEKGLGSQLLISNYAIHTGTFFGWLGRGLITVCAVLMPLLFITGWLLYLDRRRNRRDVRIARDVVPPRPETRHPETTEWLIGFASQSGLAEHLARQTAAQLEEAGLNVRVKRLAKVTEDDLQRRCNALFIVSTFGDGEAPDSARGFERKLLSGQKSLPHLSYAVLGLGDRQYQHFCGFAKRLHQWLSDCGGRIIFAPIEVNRRDAEALHRWHNHVGQAIGSACSSVRKSQVFENWTLDQRQWLNEGSQGSKVFLLGLISDSGTRWDAGDLVEVMPRNTCGGVERFLAGTGIDPSTEVTVNDQVSTVCDALQERQLPSVHTQPANQDAQSLVYSLVPLGVREYSIASTPEDGSLQLIVRQEQHSDGNLGVSSAWLTQHAELGGSIALRVRTNKNFHLPNEARPMIFIGNGTGLGGLRALLRARIAGGEKRNWLLYGERNEKHDFLCAAELKGWLARGDLARLDLAFSRDQLNKVYVQDRLYEAGEELHRWLAEGAAIYVCGTMKGMASGVDQTLNALLGEKRVQALIEQKRYRRDVY